MLRVRGFLAKQSNSDRAHTRRPSPHRHERYRANSAQVVAVSLTRTRSTRSDAGRV
jgi:hypothetical protein